MLTVRQTKMSLPIVKAATAQADAIVLASTAQVNPPHARAIRAISQRPTTSLPLPRRLWDTWTATFLMLRTHPTTQQTTNHRTTTDHHRPQEAMYMRI